MRVFLGLCFVVCGAECVDATAGSITVEAKIQQLERELNDALSRADPVSVDILWADDFQFVSPSGQISNKKARLEGLKPSSQKSSTLVSTLDDVQVRVYGPVAVAIVKTTWRGTSNGRTIADPYVATHVWVRSGARWRLSSGHFAQVDSK